MVMNRIPVTVNGENHISNSILRSLSDKNSLELFKSIAHPEEGFVNKNHPLTSQELISIIKLTRKQYYSRISTLISSGLVKRSNGKYLLTSLGKIIYGVYVLIDQAIQNHWKLKAIDALESKSSSGILDEEKKKVVDMLIDNKDLKAMLGTRQISSKPLKSAPKDVTLSALMQVNST
jgi:predicted transcriptional regulator